jgi:hypothetical protein
MLQCVACHRELPRLSRFCPECGAANPASHEDVTGPFEASAVSTASVDIGRTSNEAGRFEPGQVLAGRYRIVSRLGKGGMGEVFRADDLRLGQSVALKFLPVDWAKNPQRLAFLHDEVKMSRQVSHPNVCRVYDIGEADGQSFLAMEFIDGEDLASLLRRIGRLPPDKGIDIARQLCLGLAAAHDKGVIHRDLKPANIMLDGRGHVRITDFGLARLADRVTGPDAQLGTPAYMAPEQIAGKEASVRSDIYALGLVLYEVFTGKKAFQAATRAELLKLQESSSPSSLSSHVTGLDPAVERVILRCLEREPSRRPPSAIAVAAALPGGDPLAAALAAGEVPSPQMVAAAGDTGAWPTSYAIGCLVGTLLALLLCILLYEQGVLVGRVDLTEPTDVLKRKARTILEDLKFGPGKDSAIGFDHDRDYLIWIQTEDHAPERWSRLKVNQPAALYFWYRQSPEYLIPNLFYPYAGTLEPGRITLAEPPAVKPDMVSVKLDLSGRLLELHAVAPLKGEWDAEAKKTPDVVWEWLFKAAELDIQQFAEVPSQKVPPGFADQTKAWQGISRHANGAVVTVEAAAYKGRPVFFQIVHPEIDKVKQEAGSEGMLDKNGEFLFALLFSVVALATAVLGPRNLYVGLADRQGAFRLAFWSFMILMVVWLFETHHVFSLEHELRLVTLGLAYALSWSGLLWLTYIALEPRVRQWWPESLITWTRLMAGQWRDPRVGRDVLLGVLVGLLVQVVDLLGRIAPAWFGEATPNPYWDWWIPNTFIQGYWTGNFLINLVYSFRWVFFFKVMVFLVLRVLLKRTWPAAILLVLLDTASWIGTSAGFQEPSWYWLFGFAVEALFTLLLIRVGILSAITAMFIWYCVCFPLSPDLSVWYAQSTILITCVVLGIAGAAFYTSMAGRSLVQGD